MAAASYTHTFKSRGQLRLETNSQAAATPIALSVSAHQDFRWGWSCDDTIRIFASHDACNCLCDARTGRQRVIGTNERATRRTTPCRDSQRATFDFSSRQYSQRADRRVEATPQLADLTYICRPRPGHLDREDRVVLAGGSAWVGVSGLRPRRTPDGFAGTHVLSILK